mgnify:CR=1 FL=1
MKYLVIGLGTYGRELAINLSLQGNEVIGVDHRSENIEAVKEQLMTVYELDAKDENSLKLLPLKNMDIVIVAIGELSLIHIPSPRDMRRSRMPSSA